MARNGHSSICVFRTRNFHFRSVRKRRAEPRREPHTGDARGTLVLPPLPGGEP